MIYHIKCCGESGLGTCLQVIYAHRYLPTRDEEPLLWPSSCITYLWRKHWPSDQQLDINLPDIELRTMHQPYMYRTARDQKHHFMSSLLLHIHAETCSGWERGLHPHVFVPRAYLYEETTEGPK